MKRAVAAAIAALVFTGCQSVADKAPFTISSDAVVVNSANSVYVLNRTESSIIKLTGFPTNSVYLAESDYTSGILGSVTDGVHSQVNNGFLVAYESKIKDGFNPHDIAVVNSSKGYICSNSKDEIAVINPKTGTISSYITLSKYALNGITTNATKMALIGSNLYVACQMRNGYKPGEGSLIIKIDTNTDTVVDEIRCTFKNVLDMDVYNGNLVVTSLGSYSAVDGGVELVNPSTKSVTTLIAGTTLGFDIQSIAIDESRNQFYGSIYRAWGDAPIVRYNSSFAPIDTIPSVVQSNSPTFKSGKLYFGESGATAKPALVVWDPATKKVASYPTTLAPQAIAVVD